MPMIPNYPQNLMDEHMNWHSFPGNPAQGGRAIDPWPSGATEAAPGSGQEFLQFHRNYITEFHTWYDGQSFADQNAVAAWHALPPALKVSGTGWPGAGNRYALAENRLTTQLNTFATADDLGRFIEWQIHGWIHGAASSIYNEPVLGSFMSPESTYFWGIHGLVDWWWQQWEQQNQKTMIKDIIDTKGSLKNEIDKFRKEGKEIEKFRKDGKEIKEIEKFRKEEKEFKEIEKTIKEKDKEKDLVEGKVSFEGDPVQQLGDPVQLLGHIAQRLDALERQAAVGRAFIQPEQRPDVGAGMKKEAAGSKKVTGEELDQPKGGAKGGADVEVHPLPKVHPEPKKPGDVIEETPADPSG